MNPLKYAQMMKYLTRAKKQKPDLPDVFFASQAPIPEKTLTRNMFKEAQERFKNAKAGGGMLVQPGFGGVRQGYKEDKYVSPSNVLKDIDIPEKTKQKYVLLLKGINKWKKDPSAENWIEIFRKGDGLNQTQESLNVRRYITGKSYQGKKLFPQVKEHFEKMNLKKIIGPDVKLIKDYTPEYFKKNRTLVATQASAVAKLARSADEVREIAPFFKRATDPKKLNVLNITKKLVPGYNSLNEYDQIAALENVSKRVSRYLEFLEDTRKVGKLQKPQNAEEIISFIRSNMSDFEFGTSTIRNMKFSARDAALGLERGTTRNTRAILYDLKEPGKVIDEVAGLSATYQRLPGYTGLTQIIDADVNQLKNTKIDIPFSSKYLDEILKGDFTNVANHNREARIFMRANPGVKIPLIVTGENLDPSKHIKYFNDLLPEEQKNIKAIAKKNKFVLKTDALPIKTLIASFGDGTCAVQFGKGNKDGGRIGYATGPASLTRCIESGAKNFNDGKFKTADQIKDGAKLLRGGRAVLSALSKYGIVPELAYVGLEAAGRTVLGEQPTNALLKSIDTLTFGATDFTSEIEAEKFGEYAKDKLAVDKFQESKAKVRSILDNISRLEELNLEGGEIDVTQNIQTLKAQLQPALDELRANTINPDIVQFIDTKGQEIADAQLAKSPFAKQSLTDQLEGFPGIKDYTDTEATRVFPFQQTQKQLNEKVLQSLSDVKDIMQYSTSDAINLAQAYRASGENVSAKDVLAYRDSLRNASLSELAQSGNFSPESIYGAQGVFSTPLPGGALDKKPNVIPEMEKEIVGQTNVANPFDFDISDIGTGLRGFAAAGGGIAKSAGINQGPPPVRGPNSQGLLSLKNRVRNY